MSVFAEREDEYDDSVMTPDHKFVIQKIPLDENNPVLRHKEAFLCKGFTSAMHLSNTTSDSMAQPRPGFTAVYGQHSTQ